MEGRKEGDWVCMVVCGVDVLICERKTGKRDRHVKMCICKEMKVHREKS